MKLEKREITLNETDSISDVAYFDKCLLYAYQESLTKTKRKETAKRLLRQMQETAEELLFLSSFQEEKRE